jgi:hypothetical protein
MLAVDKECPLRSEKAKLDDAKIIAKTLLRAVSEVCGELTSYEKADIAEALSVSFSQKVSCFFKPFCYFINIELIKFSLFLYSLQ